MATFEEIKQAMVDLDDETLIDIAKGIVEAGGKGAEDCMKACQEGLKVVGDLFEEGEYFVGDLSFSGELMGQVVEILKPVLGGAGEQKVGRMILCTVKDDLHDIGKNIVRSVLEAGGFEVLDLGIDVPPEKIVDVAKSENINIIALSGVLTLAITSMKATVDAFKDAGMREDVHIIIGGAPTNSDVCAQVGADEWAILPQKTLKTCLSWAGIE